MMTKLIQSYNLLSLDRKYIGFTYRYYFPDEVVYVQYSNHHVLSCGKDLVLHVYKIGAHSSHGWGYSKWKLSIGQDIYRKL